MSNALIILLPEIIVLLTAFGLLLWNLITKEQNVSYTKISLGGLLLAFLVALRQLPPQGGITVFYGAFHLDTLTLFIRWFALASGILALLASHRSPEISRHHQAEFQALLLFVIAGMMLLSGSTDLIMFYIAFELIAIPSYLLASFFKTAAASREAGLKYLLLGGVTSGCFLYGLSLLFGLTGTTYLPQLTRTLFQSPIQTVHVLALLFILIGLGFKISLVPFHMWTPDVYEGAPTPVTAFFSVGPKAAGLVALSRLFLLAMPVLHMEWSPILLGISMATMTLGNIVAIWQSNVKRMLAYSSIAHMGYLLIGLVASGSVWGLQGLLIYLVAYLFMNFGAFLIAIAVQHETKSSELAAFSGLSERKPFLALAMAVFMLSLTGLPPLAGFIGKFYLFGAAIDQGLLGLALVGVINSVISLFYYANVIRYMYLQPATLPANVGQIPIGVQLGISVTVTMTFVLGIYPEPLVKITELMTKGLL